MSRTTRNATFAVAALLTFVGAAPAWGQDDLPPLPPLPKPSDKAVFKLIVEGSGGASQTVNGGGSNGVCDIFTKTSSGQTYQYGRGKGLRVVFSKYKFPGGPPIVLIKRGRSQVVLFTVVGSYEGRASGSATRSGDPASCAPANETVGDEEGCGPSGQKRTVLSLASTLDGKLELGVSDATPGIPGTGCGSNGVESVSGAPYYGWPNFPPLNPERMPVGKIFGKRKAFKIGFEGSKRGEGDSVAGSFVIRTIYSASHDAVARFVREKAG